MQGASVSYFQNLTNFMGFENGLIAMAAERRRYTPFLSTWPTSMIRLRKSSSTT
jgi:hypothetical protein